MSQDAHILQSIKKASSNGGRNTMMNIVTYRELECCYLLNKMRMMMMRMKQWIMLADDAVTMKMHHIHLLYIITLSIIILYNVL